MAAVKPQPVRRRSGQAAELVARILGGTPAADLPVRHPRRYYFVVNRAAAQVLGLRIAPEVLGTADRVLS